MRGNMQSISQQLVTIEVGKQIQFHDNKTAFVIGVMDFESLEKQEGASAWRNRSDGTYRIIQLGDGQFLVYFPEKEAGTRKWFLMQVVEAENISAFIKEYAQDFGHKGQGKNGQTYFEWQNERYRMLDIGKQNWTGKGDGFLSAGTGESRHVLAVSTEHPGQYYMVVDSVKGPGADTLLIGAMINPEDSIESVN